MNLPEDFDLDVLLAPISVDAPQGVDVREDRSAQSSYNRMRDARSEARAVERQLESRDPGAAGSPADPAPLWRTLRELSMQVLSQETKDLEIAAWLTEALVRRDGLRGLAAGSRLIEGLAERYWDDLFPLPDEYGLETRVAPLAGLNGRGGGGSLAAPLLSLVLFTRRDGSPVRLYQYQASAKLPTLDAAAREQRIAARVVPFDDLEDEARTVGLPALAKLRVDAAEALDAWDRMAAVMDLKAGSDAPSTSNIRDSLQTIQRIAALYVPEEPVPPGSVPDRGSDGPDEASRLSQSLTSHPLATQPLSSPAMTRDSALQMLEAIAAFFRHTEPQSPLSYTLAEAVRRARMPWLELLDEVISDRSSRDAFLTNLGIRPPPPSE